MTESNRLPTFAYISHGESHYLRSNVLLKQRLCGIKILSRFATHSMFAYQLNDRSHSANEYKCSENKNKQNHASIEHGACCHYMHDSMSFRCVACVCFHTWSLPYGNGIHANLTFVWCFCLFWSIYTFVWTHWLISTFYENTTNADENKTKLWVELSPVGFFFFSVYFYCA